MICKLKKNDSTGAPFGTTSFGSIACRMRWIYILNLLTQIAFRLQI